MGKTQDLSLAAVVLGRYGNGHALGRWWSGAVVGHVPHIP